MELGAHLPLLSFAGERRSLGDLTAYARRARDLGYGWLCANDHLVFSRPWLDGFTALTAVIEHSGDMQLATTVALPVVRGPAMTAKAMAAIDHLSDGRLVAGVGPGSSARDHELVGLDFDERWRRLDEAVAALRTWWSTDEETFDGRHYRAEGGVLEPGPAQAGGPPIWIGSWGSPAGLRRVARSGDGWLASAYNTTPDQFARARSDLEADLTARGRTPSLPNGVSTLWAYVTEDRTTADRVLTEVLAPLVRRDPATLATQVLVGPSGACRELLAAYAEAGAERCLVWPLGDDLHQLEAARALVEP